MKKEKCDICGFKGNPCQLDIHHKDCNHDNCNSKNLQVLCANCHRLLHKKLYKKKIKEENWFCVVCNKGIKFMSGNRKLCNKHNLEYMALEFRNEKYFNMSWEERFQEYIKLKEEDKREEVVKVFDREESIYDKDDKEEDEESILD